MLELNEGVRVLHGVVHAAVADQYSGEVYSRGGGRHLLRVEVQDGVRPSGDVVPPVAFPCDDELTAHELWKEEQPVLVEGDEIVCGFRAGFRLCTVSEGVAYILRLIQI